MHVLNTPRLALRPFSPTGDFDFYFHLQSDPEVMRYIRAPEPDPEVVRARLMAQYEYAQKHPGLGSMVAAWKEQPEPLAIGVLRHLEYNPENDLELGYIIAPPFQGMGLATEIARALADYAFDHFGAPRVTAVTDPENAASQHVLRKCGFRETGLRKIYEAECLMFVLDAPARK